MFFVCAVPGLVINQQMVEIADEFNSKKTPAEEGEALEFNNIAFDKRQIQSVEDKLEQEKFSSFEGEAQNITQIQKCNFVHKDGSLIPITLTLTLFVSNAGSWSFFLCF